jgi:hypothetical protein
VSLADKVHNARAILRDLRKLEIGEKVWARFSQPKEQTLWYYRSLADRFCEKLPGQLASELDEIVGVLEAGGCTRNKGLDSRTSTGDWSRSRFIS